MELLKYVPMFILMYLLMYLPLKLGYNNGFIKGRYKDKRIISKLDERLEYLQDKKERLLCEIDGGKINE